jgi:hypothetical protein
MVSLSNIALWKRAYGAHVLAHLLAHPAGVAVGGEAVEQHPERLPGPGSRPRSAPKLADGREVAHEGEAGPQGKARSTAHAWCALIRLAGVPGATCPASSAACGPLRSGARSTGTPRSTPSAGRRNRTTAGRRGGEEEQRQGRDDQQQGEVDEVLRPEGQAEKVELAGRQVEQDGLLPSQFTQGTP